MGRIQSRKMCYDCFPPYVLWRTHIISNNYIMRTSIHVQLPEVLTKKVNSLKMQAIVFILSVVNI